MGGSVSTGRNHSELIDNLVEAKYIRKPEVEKVFRAVDRAFYFLPEFRNSAYGDIAWKNGNLHLSSPCIYTEVMEQLSIEPGLSFLNIGSGTGYLSTMVGLMLGSNGVNHGIEIHSDVVDYAYEKLDEFKKQCNAIDMFDFCEPHFVVGNGLELCCKQKYDRIYCGAACPETYHKLLKKYLKVGGILIVPCEDELLKIVRSTEKTWERSAVLSVSFSTLQSLKRKDVDLISIYFQPASLQDMCRSKIRSVLRDVIEHENPELLSRPERKSTPSLAAKRHRHLRGRLIFPIMDATRTDANESNRALEARVDFGSIVYSNYGAIAFRDCLRNLRRHSVDANLVESDASDSEVDSENFDSSSASSETDVENEPDSINESNEVTNEVTTMELPASNGRNVDLDNNENRTETAGISTAVPEESRLRKNGTKNDHKRSFIETSSFDEEQSTSDPISKSGKENDEVSTGTENNQPKKLLKREKLDSGISEESDDSKISASTESSLSESSFLSVPMDLENDNSEINRMGESYEEENIDEITDNAKKSDSEILLLKYRELMEKKVSGLPLPVYLKRFLNYHRDFLILGN